MGNKWIIWYSSFLHISWGIQMVFFNMEGPDWNGGVSWNGYYHILGLKFWGWAMLICAVLAVISLIRNTPDRIGLSGILPQQFIVLVGGIHVVFTFFGIYDDFTISRLIRVIPIHFWLAVFHAFAILEYFGGIILLPKQKKKLLNNGDDTAGHRNV